MKRFTTVGTSLLVFTLLASLGAHAQTVVTFPDIALELCVRSAIDKPVGDILESDLLGLTSLNCFERGIISLGGLESATSLTSLVLSSNNIVSLSPLSQLTNLTQLRLEANRILTIAPLSGLTNLRELRLNFNLFNDISPLSTLTNLTELRLLSDGPRFGDRITNVGPLAGLVRLETLDLRSNDVRDIRPLASLLNLSNLLLFNNEVIDVSPLLDNGGLGLGDTLLLALNPLSITSVQEHIPALLARGITLSFEPYIVRFVDGNLTACIYEITEISPLLEIVNTDLFELIDLSCDIDEEMGVFPVANLDGLEHALFLESLELSEHLVSDVTPLGNLPFLTTITLDLNLLREVSPLAGSPSLFEAEINLDDNPLSQLASCVDIPTMREKGATVASNRPCLSITTILEDLVGLTQSQADAAIVNAGLILGAVKFETSFTVPAGVVISWDALGREHQDPFFGTRLIEGTIVDLVVSLGRLVTIPDVTGLRRFVAESILRGAGLTVGAVTFEASANVPVDHVVSQNPGAGSPLIQGMSVDLAISLGAFIRVPDVVDLPESQAKAIIVGADLTVGTQTSQRSETVPIGSVISQNPVADAAAAPGSPVDLVVSSGPSDVTVPGVVGLSQTDAEDAIVNADLVVGTVSFLSNPFVPAGIVILQDPLAGTSALPGSPVDLVVSTGPGGPAIAFPDPNLEACVREAIGKPFGDISATDLLSLTSLSCRSRGIANLGGLQFALNLMTLELDGNLISDLSPLGLLTNLTFLTLNDNRIANVAPLATLVNLTYLDLFLNQIVDVTPLGTLTDLTTLGLGSNQVSNVLALATLTSLTTLQLSGNAIVDISGLVANEGLAEGDLIDLRDNPLSQTALCVDVLTLEERGATVVFDGTCSNSVTVPNVVGLSQSVAESTLLASGLTPGAISLQPSETVPFGQVISQNPSAGTSVIGGAFVDLVVSSGSTSGIAVPSVIGLTQTQAESAIVAEGLTVGTITPESSDTVPVGEVIGQDPGAGISVAAGTPVNLVVSAGSALGIRVPAVIGLTQAEAEAAIGDAGLIVGVITFEFTDAVPAGDVIRQDPQPMVRVDVGSAVDIVVSLGAEELELCEAIPAILTELLVLRNTAGIDNDLDGDGVPEDFTLALIESVACSNDGSSLWGATLNAYELNLATFDAEADASELDSYRELIAILMAVSQSTQDALRTIFADMGMLELTGDYAIVMCDGSQSCTPAAIKGMALSEGYEAFSPADKTINEPYSGSGDLDGDGFTNLEEFDNVMATGGTTTDFADAATDAQSNGMISERLGCSAGPLGGVGSLGNLAGGDLLAIVLLLAVLIGWPVLPFRRISSRPRSR